MNTIKTLPIEVQVAVESRVVVLESLATASKKALSFAIKFPQHIGYDHEEHVLFIAEDIKSFLNEEMVLEIESVIQAQSRKTVDEVRNAITPLSDQEVENNSLNLSERNLALAKYIRFMGNKLYTEALNEGF